MVTVESLIWILVVLVIVVVIILVLFRLLDTALLGAPLVGYDGIANYAAQLRPLIA